MTAPAADGATMKDRDLTKTDPRLLADVMGLATKEGDLWAPADLGAILRHQLAAPLADELGPLDERVGDKLDAHRAAGGGALDTFGDLLRHPRPPVEMLKLTKRFARRSKGHPAAPLPGRVATILYVASIVAARTRRSARISRMDDQALRVGILWALEQPWLDESIRRLLTDGLGAVEADDANAP